MQAEFEGSKPYRKDTSLPVTNNPLVINEEIWSTVARGFRDTDFFNEVQHLLPRATLGEMHDVMRYASTVPLTVDEEDLDEAPEIAVLGDLEKVDLNNYLPGSLVEVQRWVDDQTQTAETESLVCAPAVGFAVVYMAAHMAAAERDEQLPEFDEKTMRAFLGECANEMDENTTFSVFLQDRAEEISERLPMLEDKDEDDNEIEVFALTYARDYAYAATLNNIAQAMNEAEDTNDEILHPLLNDEKAEELMTLEEEVGAEVNDLVNFGFIYAYWLFQRYQRDRQLAILLNW